MRSHPTPSGIWGISAPDMGITNSRKSLQLGEPSRKNDA
ncbi:hypothetical protein TcasGA2_TC033388 [Tribolium castaneum]|uniref:Uncharacterized protein n=1 Tax=Tribolium castaneum TaxID=7070 RepID=A0A139WGS0_TRICA|nr:hypothetical protein TcasGA2_TC033388 [Tribolium castaneum]